MRTVIQRRLTSSAFARKHDAAFAKLLTPGPTPRANQSESEQQQGRRFGDGNAAIYVDAAFTPPAIDT
jgi:hypothetical protein